MAGGCEGGGEEGKEDKKGVRAGSGYLNLVHCHG